MEYWVFQPEANITALEIANMLGKLRKLIVCLNIAGRCGEAKDELKNLLCVNDKVYDEMLPECRRHFILYKEGTPYREYTVLVP